MSTLHSRLNHPLDPANFRGAGLEWSIIRDTRMRQLPFCEWSTPRGWTWDSSQLLKSPETWVARSSESPWDKKTAWKHAQASESKGFKQTRKFCCIMRAIVPRSPSNREAPVSMRGDVGRPQDYRPSKRSVRKSKHWESAGNSRQHKRRSLVASSSSSSPRDTHRKRPSEFG